ncbi:O-antigen ligase family protein [Bradyrhizobium sp. 40]|uniref:O-antigen ligase family protein n=1 Tax=Bradyrhizobium sp. 40 TaxID=2782674 RepID=UPI001FFF1CC7|nr:O-antigen ligase family protein [Bradyrhizobium sp. 40]UPJ41145.1 O-antigen ligase family protein [Bradyrhizobium sp. 40]
MSSSTAIESDLSLPRTLVALFLILVFVGLHPLSAAELYDGDMAGGGDFLRQLAYIAIFGGLLLSLRSAPSASLSMPKTLLALLVWCWASLAWAVDPGVAFRRITLTSIVVGCCFLSVSLLGRERFKRLLALTLAAVIVADLIAVVVHPNAIQGYDFLEEALVGNWRGLHIEKNAAGAIAGAATIIFFFTAVERAKVRWGYFSMLILAYFFLYKTQSKTSFGLVPAAILLGLGYRFLYRNAFVARVLAVTSAVIFAAGAAAFLRYLPEITSFVTDPEAFTGRGMIWSGLGAYIADNWELGSGYGSFWNISSGSLISAYTDQKWIEEFIYVGHNGYLDAVAQLGIVGFGLVLIALIVVPIGKALKCTNESHRARHTMAFSLVVFCALHNFQETSFLERDNPLFVLLCFSLALLSSQSRRKVAVATQHFRPAEQFRGSRL